jgi:hypothetical protein
LRNRHVAGERGRAAAINDAAAADDDVVHGSRPLVEGPMMRPERGPGQWGTMESAAHATHGLSAVQACKDGIGCEASGANERRSGERGGNCFAGLLAKRREDLNAGF